MSFSSAQQIQGNVMLSGSSTLAISGHSVFLSWNASQNATSYNMYRGTTHGGPYQRIASGIIATSYTDSAVLPAQTLFYVTTAVAPNGESEFSNETIATIP